MYRKGDTGPGGRGTGKGSAWLAAFPIPRLLEITAGAVAMAVGFGIIGFPDADVLGVLFWLAASLILLGIRDVAIGITRSARRKALRFLEVAAGVVILDLGFFVAVFPGFGVATLIGFLFLALLAFGVSQIGVAVGPTFVHPWVRAYLVAVGILNLLLGPLLLLAPGQPWLSSILLVSTALVVDGIAIVATAGNAEREGVRPEGSDDQADASLK